MFYFISDTHFNHNKPFIYEPRGFSSVQEADAAIIKNWNETVGKNDDIYVVGDFFLGTDMKYIDEVLNTLHGKIHLIIGNHDTDAKLKRYEKYSNIVEIAFGTRLKYKGKTYYVSHYPTLVENCDDTELPNVINLFGHTHNKEKFFEDRPNMYNVACDAHNCTPVSIEEIRADIKNKIFN